MLIKINDYDITELLLSYSRSMNMTSLIGNAAVSSLSISYDNEECQFGYARLKDAIFEVQPTNNSQKYFFKAYEMPETYDGIVELTLYDSLYEFDSLYQSTLSYPTTVKKQLDEMGVLTGIEIDYTQLDSSIVNKTVNENDNALSMRDYLRWIAEIGGCNVFSSNDKYGKIIFKKVTNTVSATCRDTLNYKKGSPYTISGIEFDNSQLSFSIGNQTSNVYIVANDNPYVTSINDLKVIEEMLLGMTLDSATDVEIDYIDNLSLGDIIECPNTFKFMILDFIEEYVGGEYPDLKLSGELSTENSESVGNSVSNDVKIRLLKLQAKEIEAETLKVSRQIITLNLEVEGKANISDLNALKATIDNLEVGNLEATYAKIDLSNVNTEHVGNLLVDAGLITDLTIVDGHVTGDLTGVRIHGDLIDANTLKVKNLLLEGPDGLIYQINALASGLTQTELTEEIYNQKMLGSVLVNQSVTTEQLNTKEIFSNSAVIAQIFAQDVTATGTVTGMTFKGGSININEKFIVDSLGNMKSINGEFSGKIDALSGTIGGWKISENKLLSKNENTTSNGSREEKTTTIDSLLNEIIFQYKSYYDDEIDTLLETLISHDGISWKSEYYSNGLATLSYLASLSSDSLRLQDSAHGNYAILTMDRLRLVQNETSLVDIGNSNGNAKFLGGVYTNNKTGATDGKVGGALGTNGYLHLVADKSRNNPGISFYYDMATSATHQLTARQNDFYFNRPVTVNGTIRINNSTVLGTYNSKGTAGNLIYCSNDDRVIIGTSSTDVYGNMDIYSGDFMKFHASSNSVSYKATALEFFREQSDSHRTILRPASNSGAYLGTTTYRWNTAFFTNAITASDLKEKDVIEDFDFKVKDFIMGLEPIAYRRKGKGDTGKRIHIGLGAQTLASHIKDLNLGDLSMVQASIIDGENEKSYHGEDIDDELLLWGINYTELTPYLILMLKEQQNEINSLKKEIDEIKQMILKQEDK